MKNNSVANLVAEKIFGQKKEGDIPTILCRRNVRPDLTYKLHDSTWEGLRRVVKNGVVSFEIDHNFNLIINEDGTCLIPDTEYNRRRLEGLSKPQVTKVKRKRIDFSTVPPTEYEEDGTITEPPFYQRVESNLIEQSLVDKLTEQVRQKLLMEGLPGQEEEGFDYRAQAEETPAKPVPAKSRVDDVKVQGRRRGRPGKDSLLSPIRGQDDDQ